MMIWPTLFNGGLIRFQENEGWTVLDLIQDKDGEIWFSRFRVGDVTHPLCQVLDKGIRCYGREEGLEVSSAERLFARDSSGAFWMGDGTEITRWRPGESKTVFRPESLHSDEGNLGISALVPETDGSLWVGMAISGRGAGDSNEMVNGTFPAVSFAGAKWRDTGGAQPAPKDRQNTLWVGTSQGLYKIHGLRSIIMEPQTACRAITLTGYSGPRRQPLGDHFRRGSICFETCE
jgi:ligand-binding sensor domain-containing protein